MKHRGITTIFVDGFRREDFGPTPRWGGLQRVLEASGVRVRITAPSVVSAKRKSAAPSQGNAARVAASEVH
jgi:hypothetical protein